MNSFIKLVSAIWNFIFEKSFNMFDVGMFYFLWRADYQLTDWQLWAILIPCTILSATFRMFGDKLRTLT